MNWPLVEPTDDRATLDGGCGRRETASTGRKGDEMKRLNLRQGVIGGSIVAIMSAAGIAGRSPDPLPAFVGVLAFCVACAAPVFGLAVLVNRAADKPPVRW